MPKPKKIRCLAEFERLYLPEKRAERERMKEEKRLGLGVVIARRILDPSPSEGQDGLGGEL